MEKGVLGVGGKRGGGWRLGKHGSKKKKRKREMAGERLVGGGRHGSRRRRRGRGVEKEGPSVVIVTAG